MTKKAFDSNNIIDEEVGSDTDRAFGISIDASDTNCYDMVLLVRISTVDGSNYYEGIAEDSSFHLNIEVQHSSARCNNLGKEVYFQNFAPECSAIGYVNNSSESRATTTDCQKWSKEVRLKL